MMTKNKPFDNLYLYFGDSLGDMFVSCGLVHHFSEMTKNTFVHCRDPKYFPTINCLYQDFPDIHVIPHEQFLADAGKVSNSQKIMGFNTSPVPLYFSDGSYGTIHVAWERIMYENFDLPFSVRYNKFFLPKFVDGAHELKEKLTEGEKDYIVVNRHMACNSEKFNYNIDQFNPNELKIIEINPETTKNVLQYVELFKDAKQIHVLPTSIHQLVDGMIKQIKGEVFIHLMRKNFFSPVNCQWNGHRWIHVVYNEKY